MDRILGGGTIREARKERAKVERIREMKIWIGEVRRGEKR